MCSELAKNGFVAFMFDFYNKPNKISEQKNEDMTISQQVKDISCAIDFISSLKCVDKNRIGLTGHSLGGMSSLLCASQDRRVKAFVAQSAVSEFVNSRALAQFENKKWKKKGYVIFSKSWGQMKVNRKFYEDGKKYNVYKIAEKLKCPTLVFHGDMDESVSIEQSKELIKHLKSSDRFKIIKGADHCYYENNTLPIATRLMIGWFKKNLK